jgi:hypothetical protein
MTGKCMRVADHLEHVLAAEVERRLARPIDQWEPAGGLQEISAEARARLPELRRNRHARTDVRNRLLQIAYLSAHPSRTSIS